MLRTTDGERFVVKFKSRIFQADRVMQKGTFGTKVSSLLIEILLYVIMYPHARELFALSEIVNDVAIQNNFSSFAVGPPGIEKGVAKNFSITIMRPLAVSDDCRKLSVEVGPDLLIAFVGYSLL